MVAKKYVRSERGMRVDQPDMQHLAETSQLEGLAQLGESFFIGEDNTDAQAQPIGFILKGFAMSNSSAKVLAIARGSAVLPYRDTAGSVRNGVLLVGGPDAKSIDLATYPVSATPYNIYLRAEFRDDEFQNRIFWNSVTPPPSEFGRSIATRRVEDWNVTVEQVSPGAEWVKIGEVVVSAPSIAITDKRQFMFEGSDANNNVVVDGEWGGGLDRSIVRPSNGVFGLYRAIRGLQRQVQDIIGGVFPFHGWWASPTVAGGDSLKNIMSNKLARDGSQEYTGSFFKRSSDGGFLGDTGRRWDFVLRDGSARNVFPDDNESGSIGLTTFLRFLNLYVRNIFTNKVDIETNSSLGAKVTMRGSTEILLNADSADLQRRARIYKPVSTNNLDIEAGQDAFYGEGTIRLRGQANALATYCQGQNGLFWQTIGFTIPVNFFNGTVSNWNPMTLTLSPAPSPGLVAGFDVVIGAEIFANASDWFDGIFVARPPRILNANQIELIFGNTRTASSGPPLATAMTLVLCILRAPSAAA